MRPTQNGHPDDDEPKTKSKRGFASMTPAQRSAISRKGALAAHAAGTAHRWTPEQAREAGRKGGKIAGSLKRVPREVVS